MNHLPERPRALLLATTVAALGWGAVLTDGSTYVASALARGESFIEALFGYLRFFTILTNVFAAGLMAWTAWRLFRRRTPPPASLFAAALVYAAVTSVTYEALLRRLWSPRGVQFVTDLLMHDVVPALLLLFWIACAPKAPLRWRDPLRWLEFPAVYFVATELAELAGVDSPYPFLDVDRLGWAAVVEIGLVFLACFYGLGLGVVATARRWALAPALPLRTEG